MRSICVIACYILLLFSGSTNILPKNKVVVLLYCLFELKRLCVDYTDLNKAYTLKSWVHIFFSQILYAFFFLITNLVCTILFH